MRSLHLDIETSEDIVGSWRVGYNLNLSPDNILEERKIICVTYKWSDEKRGKIVWWEYDENSEDFYLPFCDKNLCQVICDEMSKADEIVYQNGIRFDERWIRGRCMYHGIKMPHDFNRYDTMLKAKKFNLNSLKLDYMGKFLLGERKVETGGLKLWRAVYRGEEWAIKKMGKYCIQDTLLLEKVANRLKPYTELSTHVGVLDGQPHWSCKYCGSHDIRLSKHRVTKEGVNRYGMVCKKSDCESHFTLTERKYKNWLKERD